MANPTQSENIALIKQDISYIKQSVQDISTSVKANYTPIGDFNALKSRVDTMHRIIGTLGGLLAAGLVAAILRTILK